MQIFQIIHRQLGIMPYLIVVCIISCILFLSVTAVIASDKELPVKVRMDKLITSAKENIVAEKWEEAVNDFGKLMRMGVKLPDKFYFQYGLVLYKMGDYEKSLISLKRYLKLAGENGKYYKTALNLVNKFDDKEGEEEYTLTEVLMQIEENMVLIKGGCFKMGNRFDDGNKDEKPVHKVCVDDFYIGKYEVTVGEFRMFVDDTGYKTEAEEKGGMQHWDGEEWEKKVDVYWDNTGFLQTESQPVVGVSWNDTQEFIKWLNMKSGKSFRLSTEAEWEYAARSRGKKYKYSWGNGTPSGNVADKTTKKTFPRWITWEGYDDGFLFTAPVGSFEPNKLGLYDMTGNVWEWCSDWYDKEYYKKSEKQNPLGPPGGVHRVNRGSCWHCGPELNRVTFRSYIYADYRFITLGFRLAMTP